MLGALDLDSVRAKLARALKLRQKYTPCRPQPGDQPKLSSAQGLRYEFQSGLLHILGPNGEQVVAPNTSVEEFYADMGDLFETRNNGAVGSFCFQRLRLLQTKWELYQMANFDVETEEMAGSFGRDFYNVRKVDTHIHHSAAMNAKHLLRFIKAKLKKFPNDVVMTQSGKEVTLIELFTQLGIKPEELSLDMLNVMADQTVFCRFDRFNQKYSPMDKAELRTVFLKTDNEMGGRYLAELTRELLDDLESTKYQHTEWRISIYGRKKDEWLKLARWVIKHKLISPNNRWMIQVPRLYSVYRSSGQISCFQDMIDNIFVPMIEATLDPKGHTEVSEFLEMISGFDSVDDESKSELKKDRTFSSKSKKPEEWTIMDNPSYKYYNFYLQTNIRILNSLRASLGLSTFGYRPHAGEAGELHHLDTAFLLADSINHGINLRKSMPLQYLFYLAQVGLAVSPCSNNHLFLSYQKSPFLEFFNRGLNVSLSTDDPLMFHQTKEPLMEEYSLAKQFFRLQSADMCELARNSVLQCQFPASVVAQWMGTKDPEVNNIDRTNVPQVRVDYRLKVLADERRLVESAVDSSLELFRRSIPLTRAISSPEPTRHRTTSATLQASIASRTPLLQSMPACMLPQDSAEIEEQEEMMLLPDAAMELPSVGGSSKQRKSRAKAEPSTRSADAGSSVSAQLALAALFGASVTAAIGLVLGRSSLRR